MLKRLKVLNAVCGKLAEKAKLIEEKERSLEGLSEEEKKVREKEVKAETLAIEKEAKDMIENFRC